jgi:hypothetical protein
MIADWAFVTLFVVTVKLAAADPAVTVVLGGTVAAAGLSLDSATTKPPDGAAAVSVTVPVAVLPARMSVGLTVSDDSETEGAGDGVLVVQPDSVADAELVPSLAARCPKRVRSSAWRDRAAPAAQSAFSPQTPVVAR